MIRMSLKINMVPLRKAPTSAKFAVAAFVQKEGDELLAESREEVPVETGATWLSGYAEPKGRLTDTISTEVGYTTDYAIWPHEMLDYHHPTGKAKFLEDPFVRRSVGFEGRAGQALMAHLNRLG